MDSDDSQERSNEYFENETQMEKKQVKKKKRPKDETEQPVYPCDNCVQCFTTQRDLKVNSCSFLICILLWYEGVHNYNKII